MKILKKYQIKIPNNVEVFYNENKKILLCKHKYRQKILKLKLKLVILEKDKIVAVSNVPFENFSNEQKKRIKALQGTTVAQIKQLLMETETTFYKKLQFVGIGYRAFGLENYEENIMLLKLGFSHFLYVSIPKTLKMKALKFTKLFIVGNSYLTVTQQASCIKRHKKPEPYKGKGILYENEKIKLKEGKKV